MKNASPAIRIDPNLIPSVEKSLLCATFLEAVIRFYQNPDNLQAFEEWCARKGDDAYGSKTADILREKYPNHIPLEVAAEYLDVSPRQLSKLIAEGRQPFASFGANIGIKQKYTRVYTERFIAYKMARDMRI